MSSRTKPSGGVQSATQRSSVTSNPINPIRQSNSQGQSRSQSQLQSRSQSISNSQTTSNNPSQSNSRVNSRLNSARQHPATNEELLTDNNVIDSTTVPTVSETKESIPLEVQLGLLPIVHTSQYRPHPLTAEQIAINNATETEQLSLLNNEELLLYKQNKQTELINNKLSELELTIRAEYINYQNSINIESNQFALIQAVMDNRIDLIRSLIQSQSIEFRPEYVNIQDIKGNSAIFYCLNPDSIDILTVLLDYGADVNLFNNNRNTVLHISVALNYRKTVKLLIEHNAQFQVENWEHNFPHQMNINSDTHSAWQNYINSCYENHSDNLESRKYFNIHRIQRAYYRGLFDYTDHLNQGVLSLKSIQTLLKTMQITPNTNTGGNDYTIQLPDNQLLFDWFIQLDRNNNGQISFEEFLYAMQLYNIEKEKLEKKNRRKALLRARRLKAKQQESQSLSQQSQSQSQPQSQSQINTNRSNSKSRR